MTKLAPVIHKAIEDSKGTLKHLHKACDKYPPRSQQDSNTVLEARKRVAEALNIPEDKFDIHHPASEWRHELVQNLLDLSVRELTYVSAFLGVTLNCMRFHSVAA